EACACGGPALFQQRFLLHPRLFLSQLPRPHHLTWQYMTAVYRSWRQESARRGRLLQLRLDVLDALSAAYRQYHTAAGGYFVPRRVSPARARRLLTGRTGWLRSRCSAWADDVRTSQHVLTVADLAALWH